MMKNVVKEFERILYNSLVYYPSDSENVASTFKVSLPEIYYDKYKMLNEQQRKIIANFIDIFLNKLQAAEQCDNRNIKNGFMNFNINKFFLLNKQNIILYLLKFFEGCIDPYHDIKMLDNAIHNIPIENNNLCNTYFPIFIGDCININQLASAVILKISSKYQNKIIDFINKHNISALYLDCIEEMDLYYTFIFFDGELSYFRKAMNIEIKEFNSN